MVNDTMAFFTSFDEDCLPTDTNKNEHSAVEWEERLSALYDDQEDVDYESERNESQQHVDNAAASFNSALAESFQSRTPMTGGSKVSTGNDFFDRSDATPARKPEPSPLISFAPRDPALSNPGQRAGFDLASASLFTSSTLEAPQHVSGGSASGLGNLPSTETAKFSPRESSDKENLTSPTRHPNVKESFTQSPPKSGRASLALASSLKFTPSKKVTFSPDSSPRSHNGHSAEVQGELPRNGDELTSTFGASHLDESFTPLRAGLFVQGKSPGRSTSRQSPGGLFSQASSSTTTNRATTSLPSSVSLDNLDENLAAQMSRLRKMAAEALRNCKASGVGMDSEGQEEEEEDPADRGVTRWPATAQRPAVGK